MSPQARSNLLALCAVLLWSTVGSAFKLSLRHLSPETLLLYAALVSTGILGITLVYRGELRATLLSFRKHWLRSLALGALNPCLYYLLLFEAFDRLLAQEAQVLNYSWAIAMAILAVPLLGQKLSRFDIFAIALSYSGVIVIATRGTPWRLEFTDALGVLLALCSTVVWALYWIYNTKDPRPPLQGLFLNFLCGVPLIALYCLFFGTWTAPGLAGSLGAVYIGLFEMGITFILWLMALKLTESTARTGQFIFLSPLLSLVFIYYLVGEPIHVSTLGGLLLILSGLVLQNFRKKA